MTKAEKYRIFEIATLISVIILIAFAVLCPALYSRCPQCEYTPTFYEARNTAFCPECGACYNLAEMNGRCMNCGEKCDTPYCPYCGKKQ